MKLQIEIDLDNSAFFNGEERDEHSMYLGVSEVLMDAMQSSRLGTVLMALGLTVGLRDVNGNECGFMEVNEIP